MWWHKVFHGVTLIHMISYSHPRLWLCACGKKWSPTL